MERLVPKPDRDPERKLMQGLLEYLVRLLQRPLCRGNPAAIRAVLGIAKRQAKLRRLANSESTAPISEAGFPITIFSAAIKAMEKKRE